jgi:uncharacterized protein involved in exopolysaccharide biosynthesis
MNESVNEIDIRLFLAEVLKKWKWILGLMLLAGLFALAISLLLPEQYQAEAMIFLPRSRTELSLASQFQTINDPIDSSSRIEGIIAIAESDEVAVDTLGSISDQAESDQWGVEEIKDVVKVSNIGDAILIVARTDDPILSADIANNWANFSVDRINQAFRLNQVAITDENQILQAQSDYIFAQAELENFLTNNRVGVLTNQIGELNTLISELSNDASVRIRHLESLKHSMEEMIIEAQALRRQVESESQSPAGALGDALAVLFARAAGLSVLDLPQEVSTQTLESTEESENVQSIIQSTTLSPPQSLTFDLQISTLESLQNGSADYSQELTDLIESLESGIEDLEVEVNLLAEEQLAGEQSEILETAYTRLTSLESGLENENARKLELESNRDLAWDTYQILLQKDIELRSEAQTGERVIVASRAIPPETSESRGIIRNVAIAGLFAFVLAVGWVVLRFWWRDEGEVKSSS